VRSTLRSIRGAVIVLAPVLFATLLASAQNGQPAQTRKAEEQFKNIQVWKETPANELIPAMHLIEGQTGMDCTYCHVEDARDKDDKKPKETARRMMRMMDSLNQMYFNGQQVITCYTCHRGKPMPVNEPMVPTAEPVLADPMIAGLKVTLPSVDQILSKYVEALGGEQALRKITSRVVTGTTFIPSGPGGAIPLPASVERLEKAPNLVVNTYKTPTSTSADGFDGTRAWSQNAAGRVTDVQGVDQQRAQRDADFYLPLDLKQQYAKMEVRGTERVNQHDAYLVVGTPKNDLPERLYFDALTGLLLRKVTVLPTQAGNSPFQVDYHDYRDTGSGVRFPYEITMSPANPHVVLDTTATIHVTSVKENEPIDNARFAKPASRQPAR
jgi:hypothetical protein